MIKSLIRAYFINLVALWLASYFISGFLLAEGLKSLLIVGLGFTTLHLFLKPILSLFLGPINFLTLGVAGLIVDSGILYLLTLYFPQISIVSWNFPGFSSTYIVLPAFELGFIGTIVISALLINMVRSILIALAQ